MAPFAYDTIRVDHAAVSVLTLQRPEVGNALSMQMNDELSDAVSRLDDDESVRAIVVTGAGRMFCAGTDLSGGGATWSDQEGWPDDGRARTSLRDLRTPTIAAVNGAAVGAGIAIALECDIRIVADDAKLGFVFARRGIIADNELHWWLPRLVGASRALELLLTGRIFSGAEAERYGLASRSVPVADVLPVAVAIADEIARATAPGAVAVMKHLVYRMMAVPDADAARVTEWPAFVWAGRQPDAAEGVSSFLERRDPAWTGEKRDVDDLRAFLAERD